MKPLKQAKKQQRGSSLLEVLIAVVIFSVGLLGLAGLQLKALKYNQDALSRSTAVILAYEVMDQMRANVPAAQSGEYDKTPDGVVTGTSVAKTDLKKWTGDLGKLLPGGKGSICRRTDTTAGVCAGPGNVFVVTVTWGQAGTGGTDDLIDADSQSVTIVGQL
ncbi:MAG: type IV pilus modification protein PilV [Azovibrio sp.]